MGETEAFYQSHFSDDRQDPRNRIQTQCQSGRALYTPNPSFVVQVMTQCRPSRPYQTQIQHP